jgi:ATP-dependent Clp endopeptidase proteolytic subunit ClpP
MNFLYTVDPFVDEPIMLINRHIGMDDIDGMGIMGDLFQQELLALDGMDKKRIQVWINSPGGIVMDGYSIYNAILKSKTPVDTYNVGIAASIAGVIFMAGRKRIMSDYASLMMHNPFGGTDKKQLDAMKGSLVTMLSAKCGTTPEEVSYLMDRTTWMNAAECLEKGFCNEIEVTSDHNKKHMPAVSAKAMWAESNNILNNIFKVQNNMDTVISKNTDLSLIANYLGLNTEATGTSILTEMKNKVNAEILNRTKAEEELDKFKKEMDKMKNDMEEMDNKYKAKCKEYDDMQAKAKADMEEADKKAKASALEASTTKAKAMVEGFVKSNKIKADAVDKWTALAVTDFDGIKNMLEELPTNGKAAVIDASTQNSLKEGEHPTSAMYYMANIKNNIKKAK